MSRVALTCLPTRSSNVMSNESAKGGNETFRSQILKGHIQGFSSFTVGTSTCFIAFTCIPLSNKVAGY